MEKHIISTSDAPAAIGPYAQAILVGETLFSSGQLGIDPKIGDLPGGIAAQTRQSLANIDAILCGAGFNRTDVVKTVVYITDMGSFSAVNEIYASFFGDHKPARSCVEVSRLPKNGLVEIEIVAIK